VKRKDEKEIMKNIKSVTKGALWEIVGFLLALLAVKLFINSKSDAYWMTVLWPVFRIITWQPYEKIFKSLWVKIQAIVKKIIENGDSNANT
jgi:hypothetical protein